MRFLRHNGLSVFFLVLFLAVLVGQAIAGHAVYNEEEMSHAKLLHEQPETLSLGRYVTSSSFGQAVMENWQSEYLQFVLFVMASVWLVQRGSTESKKVDQAGPESDEERRSARTPRTTRPNGRRRRACGCGCSPTPCCW